MRLGVAVKGAPVPDITTSDALREVLRAAPAVASIDPHGGATRSEGARFAFEN